MGAAAVIAASLLAYLAAGIALLLGAGWGTALLVLVVTGTGMTLLLGLAAALRPGSGPDDRIESRPQPSPAQQPA